MLARTHTPFAPSVVVRADDKRAARLSLIRDLLARFESEGKDRALDLPDPNVVFLYDRAAVTQRLIAA